MFSLTLFLAILLEARCLVPQATSASIGQPIRYELLLAANNGKSNTAFIPRCKADLEEILLNEASHKLRDGDLVDESNVKFAKTIHVLPFHYSVSGYSGNLIEDYVTPYFLNSFRVVSLGDTFSTRGGEWAPQFKIVSIEGFKRQDGESYIVGPNTRIVRARGVVEESGHNNAESQFQDGSARPFHVSTVSDIPSNILADKKFNRMFSDNLENKNMKVPGYRKPFLPVGDVESSLVAWLKEDDNDFKKFATNKFRSCATVWDLLIATGGEDLLHKFDSEKGRNAPASLMIESFFINQDLASISSLSSDHGIPPAVSHSISKFLIEEAKVYARTISLNNLEVKLGKAMIQQGPAVQKYLQQKYEKYETLADLLECAQVPRDHLLLMPKAASTMSARTVIGYFTQIHKMSFLDKMEESGVPFQLSTLVLFLFHEDMRNLPGRRWPFRALLRTIFRGVVSLFHRPQPTI